MKNDLKICVSSICTIAVIKITSKASLFLKKFVIILFNPNSLQLKALNKAVKANKQNTTVLFSCGVACNIL